MIFVPLAAFCGRRWFCGHQQLFDTVERVGFHDAQLVVQVQAEALEFIVDDLLGALVALDAFAGEDAPSITVPDMLPGPRAARCPSRRGLLTEDGAQQFFFRRERGFALWA